MILFIIIENIIYEIAQAMIGILALPSVMVVVIGKWIWNIIKNNKKIKEILSYILIVVIGILLFQQWFWDSIGYICYIFILVEIILLGKQILNKNQESCEMVKTSFMLLIVSLAFPTILLILKTEKIEMPDLDGFEDYLGIILPTLVVLSMQLIQKMQGDKIKQLENDKIQEDIDALTRQFFLENNEEIQYLPLCPVAFALNDSQIYNRKIINDFIIQPKSVQNEILKRKSLLWLSNIKTHGFDNTFNVMKQIIENACKFSCDKLLMHDHGKYIKYCGIDYKKKELSAEYKRDYITYITTIFAEKSSPIGTRFIQILKEKDVDGFDQENTAQYLTMVSVGFFNQLIGDSDAWHDDKYQNVYSMVISDMKTNEDLFLYLLLNLWTYKDIKNK